MRYNHIHIDKYLNHQLVLPMTKIVNSWNDFCNSGDSLMETPLICSWVCPRVSFHHRGSVVSLVELQVEKFPSTAKDAIEPKCYIFCLLANRPYKITYNDYKGFETHLKTQMFLKSFCQPHTVISRNPKYFFGAKISIRFLLENFFSR